MCLNKYLGVWSSTSYPCLTCLFVAFGSSLPKTRVHMSATSPIQRKIPSRTDEHGYDDDDDDDGVHQQQYTEGDDVADNSDDGRTQRRIRRQPSGSMDGDQMEVAMLLVVDEPQPENVFVANLSKGASGGLAALSEDIQFVDGAEAEEVSEQSVVSMRTIIVLLVFGLCAGIYGGK